MPLLVLSVLYWLAVFASCVACLDCSWTLKMKAVCSSEKSVNFYLTVRRHIPESATRRSSSNLRECPKYENFVPPPCLSCRTEELTKQ
jgi:hypothetical protein